MSSSGKGGAVAIAMLRHRQSPAGQLLWVSPRKRKFANRPLSGHSGLAPDRFPLDQGKGVIEREPQMLSAKSLGKISFVWAYFAGAVPVRSVDFRGSLQNHRISDLG